MTLIKRKKYLLPLNSNTIIQHHEHNKKENIIWDAIEVKKIRMTILGRCNFAKKPSQNEFIVLIHPRHLHTAE